MIQRKSKAMLKMESTLLTPVTINFKDKPLREGIDYLHQVYGVNFFIDQPALDRSAISIDRPITVCLEGVLLKTALEYMLRSLSLSYIVKDTLIEVTTNEFAKGQQVRMTYQVLDLVIPTDSFGPPPGTPTMVSGAVVPVQGQPPAQPFASTPLQPYNSLANGVSTPVGTPMPQQPGGNQAGGGYTSDGNNYMVSKTRIRTSEDALLRLITNTIEPRLDGCGRLGDHRLLPADVGPDRQPDAGHSGASAGLTPGPAALAGSGSGDRGEAHHGG